MAFLCRIEATTHKAKFGLVYGYHLALFFLYFYYFFIFDVMQITISDSIHTD